MKKATLFTVYLTILTFALKAQVSVKPGYIELPINSGVVVNVGSELDDFIAIDEFVIEAPVDFIEAVESFERKESLVRKITLKFFEADMLGSNITVLTTEHHLDDPILFDAKIKPRGSKKYIETSIVEKAPHSLSVEQWQGDLDSIILTNFRYDP